MRLVQLYRDTVKLDEYSPIVPETVRSELARRANDPVILKRELQEMLDSLDNNGHGPPVLSPLANLVSEQIAAALKGEDVETMKSAKQMFVEMPYESSSGIP